MAAGAANDGDRGTAFGHPGAQPHWTAGGKDAVGTAYSTSSRVWFTIAHGILTEIYYPTIDRPQTRALEFLVTDGRTFLHAESRDMRSTVRRTAPRALGFHVANEDPEGRYTLVKEVIADPHLSCVLVRTRLRENGAARGTLRLFALLAPHLEVGGFHNDAEVTAVSGRTLLVAHKGGTWLAAGSTAPLERASCGYAGASDLLTDLTDNREMDWTFAKAPDGNVVLGAELDPVASRGDGFTLGVAFGDSFHNAVSTLFQSLGVPFARQRRRHVLQWERGCRHILPLAEHTGDGGALYHMSQSLLLAHEDKSYPGAMIASLSIPWGEAKGDEELGGYHLVWTRDLANSATGLLAAGNPATALRALIYLAVSQHPDGGFAQNFWVDGEPYWPGVQLDEVAFPVLLAWRLREEGALESFDPYPLVLQAAAYLVRTGPATPQERWEEASGYSPSTLASNIAALVVAACFARERGDETTARVLTDYADFLECHVEAWTVTTQGTLLPGVPRHYVRILPVDVGDRTPEENPNRGTLRLANIAPGDRAEFPAREIVDAGFLELVRYGVRRPGDPLVEDSLRVVDAVLRVETPSGPCWRRYNHDGYGQRADGGPYAGWGVGRAWPLLTGERGHYEMAAGRDARPYVRALERFAHGVGLLPEQVWDAEDLPAAGLVRGGPTGAAMPLLWAHAEYVKLLRSVRDGRAFDLVPAVAERYIGARRECALLEIWKPNRQPRAVRPGWTLRIQAPGAFHLVWTADGWTTVRDTRSTGTRLGIEFVDVAIDAGQRAPIEFTFRWGEGERWEGRNYAVRIAPASG